MPRGPRGEKRPADVIGAAVMVYPDGIWYAQVRAEDVPELVEEHIINGRVVERLALLRMPAPALGDDQQSEGNQSNQV